MVNRILFWTGFGLATRFWQLGIEMRPFFNKSSLWAYPVFGAVGASFGYWLQGVDERQTAMLQERKQAILEKRARRAEREAAAAASADGSAVLA
ncbi:NADH2 dehydrogenase subunit 14K [Madurella fahalii]|uniref:NADH2 dehydrogenase subunit 14K n=1 Tax=Madurella fahalii TaxID=1157608 RepID=A0ABQ0G9F7_9PEZI